MQKDMDKELLGCARIHRECESMVGGKCDGTIEDWARCVELLASIERYHGALEDELLARVAANQKEE